MNRREDHYTKRAKTEGYPARSVYKLVEIQKRFRVLSRGSSVLDIGASPGSWSIYVSKIIGKNGSITGVDLQPLHPSLKGTDYLFIQADAFDRETASRIGKRAPFDVVLSDAAPATTGNRTVDTARSLTIAENVFTLSKQMLRPGGNLVVKVFQGGDEKGLLTAMKKDFESVKTIKPDASKKQSFEIFFVCLGNRVSQN